MFILQKFLLLLLLFCGGGGCFLVLCFVLFCFFRAMPTVCGSSQARGQIRAVATGLYRSHSNNRSEPCL